MKGVELCWVCMQLYEGNPHPLPGISLRGVAVSRLSHALNAVLVACLMWAGAVSFKKVIKSEENQLAYAIQACSAAPLKSTIVWSPISKSPQELRNPWGYCLSNASI